MSGPGFTEEQIAEVDRMHALLQPQEDDDERYQMSAMQRLRDAQYKANRRSAMHAAETRLAISKKKRNANRRKNKAARKARSKQR